MNVLFEKTKPEVIKSHLDDINAYASKLMQDLIDVETRNHPITKDIYAHLDDIKASAHFLTTLVKIAKTEERIVNHTTFETTSAIRHAILDISSDVGKIVAKDVERFQSLLTDDVRFTETPEYKRLVNTLDALKQTWTKDHDKYMIGVSK